MINTIDKDIKLSNFEEGLLASMIGAIQVCEKTNGRIFSAKLVGVRGSKLFFETRNGTIIMNDLSSIKSMSPMRPKKGAV